MRIQDVKKLWTKAGNVCSFPDCDIELVPEKRLDRVIGEEAHIKGEKPGAPRFDSSQSDLERDSYENKILLCPTHHTEVDADHGYWTVERLHFVKHRHEEQVKKNRQFVPLIEDLQKVLEKYRPNDFYSDITIPEIINTSKSPKIIRVDASIEGGINTGIRVKIGQKISIFARGLISYDGGINFTAPEGIICNEYGFPRTFDDGKGNKVAVIWPHPGAYKTDGNEMGRIGSLIGWINEYSEGKSFFLGSRGEIDATEEGYLFLAINDAKGTYEDNDGEFRVDIKLSE